MRSRCDSRRGRPSRRPRRDHRPRPARRRRDAQRAQAPGRPRRARRARPRRRGPARAAEALGPDAVVARECSRAALPVGGGRTSSSLRSARSRRSPCAVRPWTTSSSRSPAHDRDSDSRGGRMTAVSPPRPPSRRRPSRRPAPSARSPRGHSRRPRPAPARSRASGCSRSRSCRGVLFLLKLRYVIDERPRCRASPTSTSSCPRLAQGRAAAACARSRLRIRSACRRRRSRGHGTMTATGLRPLASPTARRAVGWSMRHASWP